MDPKEFREQAEYIWNRLDDLAKTDPDAYKKFIDKQMETHKIVTASPEPRICLVTRTLSGESTNVYVNICAWKRMPYPESENEGIKLFAGKKSTNKTRSGPNEIILPVAMNDKMYEECTDTDLNRNRLFEVILDLVEDSLKIKISRGYKKHKEIYKGDLPADPRRLFLSQSQISSESTIEKVAAGAPVSSPEDLLKRLSTLDNEQERTDGSKIDPKSRLDEILGEQKKEEKKKNLIQEIGGEENTQDSSTLPRPEYALTETEADEKHPARFVLKIQLPLVSSVAECELNITEDSVELIAEDTYYLQIRLSRRISEDLSSAKFSKKTRCLVLNLPFI